MILVEYTGAEYTGAATCKLTHLIPVLPAVKKLNNPRPSITNIRIHCGQQMVAVGGHIGRYLDENQARLLATL